MLQFFDFDNQDGKATLAVAGTVLDDVDSIADILLQKGFVLTHIDSDSVYGELAGDYSKVIQAMQDLKAMGFTWNDQPLYDKNEEEEK